MKISIIIPTHNRQVLLKNVIESVIKLKDESDFEFVIVDNNSTDGTKQVAESYSQYAKYVFEKRTSFTRARKTGGENATGDILLYLDDDVIVNPGSLKEIVEVFTKNPDCGVIAGRIFPKYEIEPEQWILDCQSEFNGWSLFGEGNSVNEESFHEVSSAAGPMMAIRKDAYVKAEGFPPDTVGVETNKGDKSFNKLFIGPGDYGLCHKIKKLGYKVYYSPNISVFHIIPPVRFTVSFWRSRMVGEGYHEAITQREFFQLSSLKSDIKRKNFQELFVLYENKLLKRFNSIEYKSNILYPEEIWLRYYKSFLDLDWVLRKYPDLSGFLWQIGYNGVSDSEFDSVVSNFPDEYKFLVSNQIVYDNIPFQSKEDYMARFGNTGYHLSKYFYNPASIVNGGKLLLKLKNKIRLRRRIKRILK